MDFFSMLTLAGGLGLFLYGMNVMGDNLKKLAGGQLEAILLKLTSNRFKGFLLGLFVTAIIQSSAATTVMLVGFVNSGIMKLGQTIGIIMGANVGTTVTAWLLSLSGISGDTFWLKMLKPSSFTPVLMVIGVIMSMVCKSDKKKNIAGILLGFSILMFGMDTMSGSMSGLKDNPAFLRMLTMFSNPVMGILAGTLFTAIIQSSSASVGILQALSMTGAISFSTAIPIILGENIGASVTPIISAITGNTEAKRVAGSCLFIKIIGVLIAYPLFCLFDSIFAFSFMDANVGIVSIAVIHTLFNLIDTVLLIPFCRGIENCMVKIIPAKKTEEPTEFDTLDERFLSMPSFAIEKSRELICTMADIARKSVFDASKLLTEYDSASVKAIQKSEDLIDMYEDKLSTYLIKIAGTNLSSKESASVAEMLHCIGEIERISDHAVNLTEAIVEVNNKKIAFSDSAHKELRVISTAVNDVLVLATDALIYQDLDIAQRVEPLEQVIDRLRKKIKANHIVRLQDGKCSIELGFILSDLLSNYERIADHCSNIAVCLLEMSHGTLETHEYLNQIKSTDHFFMEQYDQYKEKYVI